MNTKSLWPIEKHLKSYLALVEYWDAGAGDTHELLGSREILHDRHAELSATAIQRMNAADDRVLSLTNGNSGTDGWDLKMLNETAVLIERERSNARLAA